MNWSLALLQAIIIAGISALISYIISTRQKRLDFSYDYRKYIVDKRKKACARIEELIAAISTANDFDYVLNPEKLSSEMYLGISKEIESVRRAYGFWINPKIMALLMGLSVKFKIIISDLGSVQKVKPETRSEIYSSIISELAKIEDALFKDIMTLDNIQAFRDSKTKDHKHKVQFWNDRVKQHSSY